MNEFFCFFVYYKELNYNKLIQKLIKIYNNKGLIGFEPMKKSINSTPQ